MLKLEDSLLSIIIFRESAGSSDSFGLANCHGDQQVSQHGVPGEGKQGIEGGGGAHQAAFPIKPTSQI